MNLSNIKLSKRSQTQVYKLWFFHTEFLNWQLWCEKLGKCFLWGSGADDGQVMSCEGFWYVINIQYLNPVCGHMEYIHFMKIDRADAHYLSTFLYNSINLSDGKKTRTHEEWIRICFHLGKRKKQCWILKVICQIMPKIYQFKKHTISKTNYILLTDL